MTDVSMAEDAARIPARPHRRPGDRSAGGQPQLVDSASGSQPTDYGGLILRGGVNAIHITLGLYSRRIEELLDELFDAYNIFDQMGDKVLLVESVADLHESYESGRVGTMLGVQGLEFIQDNTKFVPILHRLGIRIATLTYNEKNLLGNGCLEPPRRGIDVYRRSNGARIAPCRNSAGPIACGRQDVVGCDRGVRRSRGVHALERLRADA